MGPEVASRMASMRSRAQQPSVPIFRKENVDLKKRAQVLNSVVLIHGLFQACTWPELFTAELKRVHTAVMNAYRKLIGSQCGDKIRRASDAETLKATGLVAPRVLLATSRVRLLCRLAVTSQGVLMDMLAEAAQARRSWVAAISRDLAILSAGAAFEEMHGASIPLWVERIRGAPASFRRHLDKAAAEASINEARNWAVTESAKAFGEEFECTECHAKFDSKQALAVHK